ncbi:unnamed protein product [Penicillium nalgiovense]|nr:unnamed protein product [Penicillium nalgiovense]CAG8000864.1 unnamed protein product [Penicillium nalgiovense]CAG8013594.1 unnamed protein product [Penicillium nalgiovense]CAG8016146.1 unnamed protein product [Penicillium nalgiovense]CAG8023958.1 unnamed protein product [Penicillium nalgiovense]
MGEPHCPRLASRVFRSWNSKRPRNAGGFLLSPTFLKQRPESAMNQNTTWHEWCCIALPKRIRTKRALCELYEQDALIFSAPASLYRCDRMLSIRSIPLLAASMMSQCKDQIVYLGPSLSRLCTSVMC